MNKHVPAHETDDEFHPRDFVLADVAGTKNIIQGRIITEAAGEYHVQPYTADGPQMTVYRATEEELVLHPTGRMSVLDNLNDDDGNNR